MTTTSLVLSPWESSAHRRTAIHVAARCRGPQCGLKPREELIGEFDELSEEERGQLVGTLDDLLSDTPKRTVAASRFKRLVGKAGQAAAEGLRSILVDVMSEAARKAIWGPGA